MELWFTCVSDVRGYTGFDVQTSFSDGRAEYRVTGQKKGAQDVVLAVGRNQKDAHLLRDLLAVANARYR